MVKHGHSWYARIVRNTKYTGKYIIMNEEVIVLDSPDKEIKYLIRKGEDNVLQYR